MKRLLKSIGALILTYSFIFYTYGSLITFSFTTALLTTVVAFIFAHKTNKSKFVLLLVGVFIMTAVMIETLQIGYLVNPAASVVAAIFVFMNQNPTEKKVTKKLETKKSHGSWLTKIGDIPEKQIVKSGWEWMEVDLKKWWSNREAYKSKPQGLAIHAHWIGVTINGLILGRKKVYTWEKIFELTSDQLEYTRTIPLSDIRSVEMTTLEEYSGNDFDRKFFIGGRKANKEFAKRLSTYVHFGDHSSFQMKWNKIWTVYIFTNEGDRIQVAVTFDRDFAIKTHAKLQNTIEDVSKDQPKKSVDQDYL